MGGGKRSWVGAPGRRSRVRVGRWESQTQKLRPGGIRPGSRGAAGADPKAREGRGARHRPRWRREASLLLADLGLARRLALGHRHRRTHGPGDG